MQRFIAVNFLLSLSCGLVGCDFGPSASERYDVNYLDELGGRRRRDIARTLSRLREAAENGRVQMALILSFRKWKSVLKRRSRDARLMISNTASRPVWMTLVSFFQTHLLPV